MSDYERRILPQFSSREKTIMKDRAEFEKAVRESIHDKNLAGVNPAPTAAQGIKHDEGKEPLDLLSRIWLLGVAGVLAFGAKKYASHNWRGGIQRSRLIAAALRHLLAYNEGEDRDPESGLNHLHHASCCLMFASEMHETRPDLDDRYKGAAKPLAKT